MTDALDPTLWASLLTVTLIWLVTVVTPGPNFIATVQASASTSRRAGLMVAAGVAFGTAIWAAASLLGLGLIFQTAGWLYQFIKLAGAAYLIVIGVRMIWSARRPSTASNGLPIRGLDDGRAFRRGLIVDLSNPKAAAFFTSLFAVAVPPTAPLWFDGLLISLVIAIAWAWYSSVAWAMATAVFSRAYGRAERAITAAAGVVFVGFGVKLAADR